MKKLWIWLLAGVCAFAAAAAGAVWYGVYDISATDQHLSPTYWLLEVSMRRSVARRADGIAAPLLDDVELVHQGAASYDQHCRQCHGAPGVAPDPFALGLTPAPANLAHTARHWSAAELFWTTRHGIKMTGMPAWQYRLRDTELWAVIAFVKQMPLLTPAQYAEIIKGEPKHLAGEQAVAADGDAERGKRAIYQYVCVTCHEIPGIVGANAPVGPPLHGIGRRKLIAGHLPNTPQNMIRWLRAPQEINPSTVMPDLGIDPRDAADITAYLQTLK